MVYERVSRDEMEIIILYIKERLASAPDTLHEADSRVQMDFIAI
jgi:hypothetical protein